MIFGLTVAKNEEHRYLKEFLQASKGVFDAHFVYDDNSTDATPQMAREAGCLVYDLHPAVPSFAEDEGLFRGQAWKAFERAVQPQSGDWVLVIDCDEALSTPHGVEAPTVRRVLKEVCASAPPEAWGVDLRIPEVFGFDPHGSPLIRVDQLWGTIHAPRLFRYREGGQFAQGKVGVPAVPSYVMASFWHNTGKIALMHYGYARSEDRTSKYGRYRGVPGHSSSHVESILKSPTLVHWPWPSPFKSELWTPSVL